MYQSRIDNVVSTDLTKIEQTRHTKPVASPSQSCPVGKDSAINFNTGTSETGLDFFCEQASRVATDLSYTLQRHTHHLKAEELIELLKTGDWAKSPQLSPRSRVKQ